MLEWSWFEAFASAIFCSEMKEIVDEQLNLYITRIYVLPFPYLNVQFLLIRFQLFPKRMRCRVPQI